MNRKILALLLALVMVVGMFAGCGKSKSSSNELTLWMAPMAGSDAEVTDAEFWTEVANTFGKENNCTVKVEIIPWDSYEEKYLTGVTSTDGPDVGWLYMEMFYDYIEMGALADLDSYFTAEDKANYLYYDLGNIQGGQYALPFVVGNPRVLLANTDILAQAGVDAIPTTWDELTAACDAVLANCPGVTPLIQDWGNPHYGSLNEIYWPYFWSAGGEIVDDEGNLTLNSPEGLEATKFLYDMAQKGYLGSNSTACDDVKAPFTNGDVAFVIMASGNALQLSGVNWDYVTALKGPQDAETFVAADSLVMFNSCENKELAAKLMKYLTSTEVMTKYHQTITDQPPITVDEAYTGSEIFSTLFTDDAGMLRSLPVFKGASSMYDALFKNIQSMMLGELTPEEVLSKTTEYYNSNLK
ncbi:MAG: ABC transporter substrate-binding protein [Faecousia sp.]